MATLPGETGFGWQRGMAIRDGRVVAVGDESDLEGLVGPGTKRWRLGDELMAMPGITDAHLHLMTMIIGERDIDVTGSTLDQALALIGARHEAMARDGDADGWLLGHGWSLHSFGRWPDVGDLEQAAPGRPIALWAHDHHARWVSGAALNRAGLADAPAGLARQPGATRRRRCTDGNPA